MTVLWAGRGSGRAPLLWVDIEPFFLTPLQRELVGVRVPLAEVREIHGAYETQGWDGRTVYYGSQYVPRTRDGGVTWQRISPDLTANDPRFRATISGEPITIDVTG